MNVYMVRRLNDGQWYRGSQNRFSEDKSKGKIYSRISHAKNAQPLAMKKYYSKYHPESPTAMEEFEIVELQLS